MSSHPELDAMRTMALHERCCANAGIDASRIDDAMDADAPKQALIALLLGHPNALATPCATVDAIAVDTVAESLRAEATIANTLDNLEALAAPIPSAVALAAAPALLDVLAADNVDRAVFDRSALLLARLVAEAAPEPALVYGAAMSGERFALFFAPSLVAEALQHALSAAQPLTREDAVSYACLCALHGPSYVRGAQAPIEAAGRSVMEYMFIGMSEDMMSSKQKMPSDDVPRQMLTLLVELLRSGELPELAISGAWHGASMCITGRPSLGSVALDLGVMELIAEHCRAIGSAADMVSISRGKAGRASRAMCVAMFTHNAFAGQATRPDIAAGVSSGVFDICVDAMVAFAAAGVDGLCDTDYAMTLSLMGVNTCRNHAGCEAKIRSAASALSFCLDNSLGFMEDLNFTSGAFAAMLCCTVFGRDEGGSEFTFTQEHVDDMISNYSNMVRATGIFMVIEMKPSTDTIFALELCVSDKNKPLLLANETFIPYLVDALLLDPKHPRAGMEEADKIWCQDHHVECLAQLAVYKPARETLLQDPTVLPALQAVVEAGLSDVARELAGAALLALSDKKLEMVMEGCQKHVMLSYQWSYQPTVKRINESLKARGYVTWFDCASCDTWHLICPVAAL